MESDQQQEEEKEKGKQPQNNEPSQEESKEEVEKKAGGGFGSNLDTNINIQREKKNLDGGNDRTISGNAQTQHYLDSLLRRNEVILQESLKKAIGDYFGQNRQYPDANYNTMMGFVTEWLGLIDVPPGDLRNLMQRVRVLRANFVDGNFDVNLHRAIDNLDHAIDVRDIDSQIYLDHVRCDIDINAQIHLLRATGDYCQRNGHYPYCNKDKLQGFITNELQLFDVEPEVFYKQRIEDLISTYKWLKTISNSKNASGLVAPEVVLVGLGDKIFWQIELRDLPSNSEVGDGFGSNLDGAEDARDDEEEERENNQVGDGFGGNLDGANQDARDELDEDFRDDPNFSIDVEELLTKWAEEETRRDM